MSRNAGMKSRPYPALLDGRYWSVISAFATGPQKRLMIDEAFRKMLMPENSTM
jgi:hypothetical protein